jgi:hypothetical protein
MKISYRTYPVLQKLKDEKLCVIDILKENAELFENIQDDAVTVWYKLSPHFKNNIRYFSTQYCTAFEENQNKIIKESANYYERNIKGNKGCGTLLLKHNISVCYYFNLSQMGLRNCFYVFQNNCLIGFHLELLNKPDVHDNDSKVLNFPSEKSIVKHWAVLVRFLSFLKYCPIETKILEPNKKVQDIKCKYINDTSLQISHIDSSWFTNLHVSGAFGVRGHLRLQPKKRNGEWVKEWIWIKEFQKTGYARKAGKLITEAK